MTIRPAKYGQALRLLLESSLHSNKKLLFYYHVYAGQEYSLDQLPSSLQMVNGGTVEIAPDGQTAKINGQSVVVCGNVETANATVHIIDTVLMPSSSGAAAQPVGAACSAIPADGAGSTAGMAQDPAATAASNNPVLSTLVSAVQAAGLVDTLNDTSAKYTIFAPSNDAFAKIPAADLQALLANKQMLTDVLTYHVYAGQEYTLDNLPAMLTMVNGDSAHDRTRWADGQDQRSVRRHLRQRRDGERHGAHHRHRADASQLNSLPADEGAVFGPSLHRVGRSCAPKREWNTERCDPVAGAAARVIETHSDALQRLSDE